MRVVCLAAGAGGMICGSCLRDNRLAATLIQQKRDVVLVPLYTPLRTDEPNVSTGRVLFGGVNVYLQQLSGWFGQMPSFVRRWLDAPAVFARLSDQASGTRPADVGPLTVSVLNGEHGRQRRELERVIDFLRELKPDVVNLPNLMLIGFARRIRESLGAAVACTLSGEDIFLDQLTEPHRSAAFSAIRARSGDVDAYISLTRYYARHAAAHFGLPTERVDIAPLGVPESSLAPAPPRGAQDEFRIGYLARVCPEKGLHHSVDAFLQMRAMGRNCRLVVAGYLGAADRPYFERLRAKVVSADASGHFEHRGELSLADKERFFSDLHVFSVPTDYAEAKGLSVLEALHAGVPVVQPAHGSFPEFIEATGGGLLVPPGAPRALVESWNALMDDDARRRRLADAARQGARQHYSNERMAAETWRIYERIRQKR